MKGATMKKTLAALTITVCTFPAFGSPENGAVLDVESSPLELYENGCPPGSYEWAVSPDNQYLSLRYYEFNVPTGRPDASGMRRAEKRCELVSRLRIPAGYIVGIESASVRANVYASDRFSSSHMDVSYGPTTDRWPVNVLSQSYTGPIGRDVTASGRLPGDRMLFTRCSPFDTEQSIVLASVLSTRADRFGDSTIEGHRDFGAIVQEYRFVWMRCGIDPGPGPGPGPGPAPDSWYGSCRIVLETIWGDDIRDFFGTATARTENEAIRAARQVGLNACERARPNDNFHRCITDSTDCFATK
jgi:hypothetical protein